MEQIVPVVLLILGYILRWTLSHRRETSASIVMASGIALGLMLLPVLLTGRGEWLMVTLPLAIFVFYVARMVIAHRKLA